MQITGEGKRTRNIRFSIRTQQKYQKAYYWEKRETESIT